MKDAETMERWAAAMSDIVGTTRSRPVLWVTPPPYPPDPERVRPFAAAVRRVADARRMPVADLYTAFRGAGDDAGVFFRRGDLALSDRGQALCALVIARALRAE
jgi:hypothetical protein